MVIIQLNIGKQILDVQNCKQIAITKTNGEGKCNYVTFGGSNYLIYILKLFKTIVMERRNGENKWRGS
jgi:hypothetical protein